MKHVIKVPLSVEGIDAAIKELDQFTGDLLAGVELVKEELARQGVHIMEVRISAADADGPRDKDIEVRMDTKRKDRGIAVIATGPSVLFLEFGTGITFPDTHPETPEGLGRGSWSDGPNGKGHWKDPGGWWYAHGQHTYGNKAYMFTYRTVRDLEQMFENVVREVFD